MTNNTKEKLGISISIFICILLLGVFFLTSGIKEQSPPQTQEQAIPVKKTSSLIPKEVIIIKSGIATTLEIEDIKYTTNLSAESTVYDLMKQLENEEKIKFKEKTYSGMGKLIYELNGVKNNGEKNWIYYVNSVKAKVGVSNYVIKPGDVVSWRFEVDIN